jgi:2'-hydroxyisoflavone reductase
MSTTRPTRRDFLQTSLAAGAVMGLAAAPSAARPVRAEGGGRLLILGGTGFLGPHVVEAARARGHEITLFNRGRTNPHLFPDVEKLRGDRDPDVGEGLAALEGRAWDAVVDTSGYVPRHVRASAERLADAVGQYVFISSLSVYASNDAPGMDESAPVGTLEDETVEQVTGTTYGPLKALCERAAETAMPGRTASLRPGLIVGPRDSTDRFTYWPVRIARGGEVLAPGHHRDPVQYVDARDLAEWIVTVVERRIAGVFNANGPEAPTNIAELLYGCKAVTGGTATFTWADADFLAEQQVAPWMQMTVWVPPRDGYEGFHRMSSARAIARGLAFRPLADTVRDTLDWFGTLPEERRRNLRAGLPAEREAEVLAAWHARARGTGPAGNPAAE